MASSQEWYFQNSRPSDQIWACVWNNNSLISCLYQQSSNGLKDSIAESGKVTRAKVVSTFGGETEKANKVMHGSESSNSQDIDYPGGTTMLFDWYLGHES